jgi:hypothetical protein
MSAIDILKLYPEAHREIYLAGKRDFERYQRLLETGAAKDQAFKEATRKTFNR